MTGDHEALHPFMRSPLATPAEIGQESAAYPVKTDEYPFESFFPDWRRRLTRNLARRGDGRWDPLTWVHS